MLAEIIERAARLKAGSKKEKGQRKKVKQVEVKRKTVAKRRSK